MDSIVAVIDSILDAESQARQPREMADFFREYFDAMLPVEFIGNLDLLKQLKIVIERMPTMTTTGIDCHIEVDCGYNFKAGQYPEPFVHFIIGMGPPTWLDADDDMSTGPPTAKRVMAEQ